MALAAEDSFGLVERLSACFGEPGKAIFADTDDGPAGISHDARPHPGGTADAGLLAAEIARAGIDAVYSYGGRTRAPADQPLPTRIGGFGGGERARRLHSSRKHHACDRRYASLRRRDEPQCGRGLRGNRHAADRAGARALGQSARRQLDRGRRRHRGRRCASRSAASVFLAIGRQHIAPFGGQARSIAYRCVSSIRRTRTCPSLPM